MSLAFKQKHYICKMASSLSEEEFHRMQLQLIELRTSNYELEGKCKKLERELESAQEKIEIVDRDLQKANKAIGKSKKAKEVELLLQESNALQNKLFSQEEEFRLQNQTLMQELSTLVARNEELEKKVAERAGSEREKELEDEIRRLQAQNNVLQKTLTSNQEKYEKEFASLKQQQFSSEAMSEDIGDGDAPPTEPAASSETVTDLKINLETELEEKKILKEQFAELEKKSKEQISSLQEEVEKLTDKLKKKQESFMQVQSEKEAQFNESSQKLEELQAARDRDQKYYHDQIARLQADLETAKKTQLDAHSGLEQQNQELQNQIGELQKQVGMTSMMGSHQLQEQTQRHQQELADLRARLTKLTQERDDLSVQLQESTAAAQQATEQLQAARQERDAQIQALQEVSKVAEKRKSLLDELAIKYQSDSDTHHAQIRQMEERNGEEVAALEEKIAQLQFRSSDLERQKSLVEELSAKVKSLEESKGWLERRLKETEESYEKNKVTLENNLAEAKRLHEETLQQFRADHEAHVAQLEEENGKNKELWEEQEEKLQKKILELDERISGLQQEIKDGVEEKRIHEKKGVTALRDLKKQLHAERKRSEKLQDKLKETLMHTQPRQIGTTGMEDLFRVDDSSDALKGDSSSVSSWSAGASGVGLNSSMASGPQSPTTNHSFSEDLDQEHSELLNRITQIQEQKWQLEEKVRHLETSNACMADDILKKTSIIQHYVMDSKMDKRQSTPHDEKLTLKKVLDMVNKGDEHEVREMNKKLQHMLEETLTKNMHLQQNLETLSLEVVRLSKLPASTSDHSLSASSTGDNNPGPTTSNDGTPVPQDVSVPESEPPPSNS